MLGKMARMYFSRIFGLQMKKLLRYCIYIETFLFEIIITILFVATMRSLNF